MTMFLEYLGKKHTALLCGTSDPPGLFRRTVLDDTINFHTDLDSGIRILIKDEALFLKSNCLINVKEHI